MKQKIIEALEAIKSEMPGGGEKRPGQLTMTLTVDEAINAHEHLLIEAGTGTGKTLAYLLPFALDERRVVVATYTKALQDQMIEKDLPQIKKYIEKTSSLTLSIFITLEMTFLLIEAPLESGEM